MAKKAQGFISAQAWRIRLSYTFFFVSIYIALLSGICFDKLIAQINQSIENQIYDNTDFHFSLKIPTGWSFEEAGKEISNIKLNIFNRKDPSQLITTYAFKFESEIDLEKFATLDTAIFTDLGNLVENKSHYGFLIFFLNNICKTYQKDKIQTKLFFRSEANYGYVVMWRSLNNDPSKFLEVSESLEFKIPFWDKAYIWMASKFEGIGFWVMGIIVVSVFCLIAGGLGLLGSLVRKNIEIMKHVNNKILSEKDAKKIVALKKIHLQYKLKNIIVFSLLGIFYCLTFSFTTTTIFLYSLTALTPVLMGCFGYFFTPEVEIWD